MLNTLLHPLHPLHPLLLACAMACGSSCSCTLGLLLQMNPAQDAWVMPSPVLAVGCMDGAVRLYQVGWRGAWGGRCSGLEFRLRKE